MVIYQNLIKIIAFRLCNFEDIDAQIECHPLESDTRGGPPPVGTPLLAGRHKATRRVTTQHYAIKLALLTRFPPPPSEHSIFLKPSLPLNPVSRFVIVSPPPKLCGGGKFFEGMWGKVCFQTYGGERYFRISWGGKFSFFLTIIYIFYQFITDIIHNAWCTDI